MGGAGAGPSHVGLVTPEDSSGHKIERETVRCVWGGMWGQPDLWWFPARPWAQTLRARLFWGQIETGGVRGTLDICYQL